MTNANAALIKQLIAKRDMHNPLSAESDALQAQIDVLCDQLSDELTDETKAIHAAHAATIKRIG